MWFNLKLKLRREPHGTSDARRKQKHATGDGAMGVSEMTMSGVVRRDLRLEP